MEEDDADAGVTEDLPVVKPQCNKCGKNNPERWLPRFPHNMLFVVGGWRMGQPLSDIVAFDPRANRWVYHKEESIFEPRAYHAVAIYKRRIFVVGGMQERNYLSSTISYDMDKCEWKSESSMNVPRAYVAAVALGEYIYAIGGHTGVERTPSVERYCPRTSQWTTVSRMNRRRSDAAACVIKVVRSLTLLPLKWHSVAHLKKPRSTFALAQLDDELYVIGGHDGKTIVSNVERYSPRDGSWSSAPSLSEPVSAMAACLVSGGAICKKLSVRGTLELS
ncbi:kelch repeat-containing protein kel-10-like isoform X2 [Dermacentor andersoni]|uniref:kelch repeat-containing protein kel-10-like isoform X2 n=1 Tax=Dermacentor andersoni TaxID=34620 RepID=UPI00241661B3|nr:kelch-like protein 10 isoform X2 [Dermacentor andersoni]